jgi:hypothetical protein
MANRYPFQDTHLFPGCCGQGSFPVYKREKRETEAGGVAFWAAIVQTQKRGRGRPPKALSASATVPNYVHRGPVTPESLPSSPEKSPAKSPAKSPLKARKPSQSPKKLQAKKKSLVVKLKIPENLQTAFQAIVEPKLIVKFKIADHLRARHEAIIQTNRQNTRQQ